MTEPPSYAVIAAQLAAMKSPCAKSKRGAALFDSVIAEGGARAGRRNPMLYGGTGFNGQPTPFRCDGSKACRAACGQLCLHAEQRAIIEAIRSDDVGPRGADLVHVKVVDGVVVPGGGPSCWQCSRLVVDSGIRGVWLFEQTDCPSERCPFCTGEFCNVHQDGCECGSVERHTGIQPPQGEWTFYDADQFHRLTLRHERNRLPIIEAR